jgi:hypothetical protein
MPTATRTFRVFVSSTFEDLVEERDTLQRNVFPRLRTLCEQHCARFQAIDLCWGVRDEAALGQKTMDICLHDAALTCRPEGRFPRQFEPPAGRVGGSALLPADSRDRTQGPRVRMQIRTTGPGPPDSGTDPRRTSAARMTVWYIRTDHPIFFVLLEIPAFCRRAW